jgi:hypothetical protein
MSIVRLVGGILLFAAGLLLGISVIFTLSQLKVDFRDAYGVSYFIGSVIGVLGLATASFFMMKYGIRLTKKKN